MAKTLLFEEVKKAELGKTFLRKDLLNCSKAIYAAVAWPGKRPGFVVVIALDPHRHLDGYDIHLLAEFESESVRDLVRQCGVFNYGYSPDKFIGDWKNDAADKFIRELNNEQGYKGQRLKITITPMLEMDQFYPFALDEIRRLLDEDRRMLFLKTSVITNYISEIGPGNEPSILDFGDYPAVEALTFAVVTLLDLQKRKHGRKLPTQLDTGFRLKFGA